MSYNPDAHSGAKFRSFWYATPMATFTVGQSVIYETSTVPFDSASEFERINYGSTATICTTTAGSHAVGAVYGYSTTAFNHPVQSALPLAANIGIAVHEGVIPGGLYMFGTTTINDYLYVSGIKPGLCYQTAAPDFSIRNAWMGKALETKASDGTHTVFAWIKAGF